MPFYQDNPSPNSLIKLLICTLSSFISVEPNNYGQKYDISTLLMPRLLSSRAQFLKTIYPLSCLYSLDSSYCVLSDEYLCAKVSVIFQVFCILLYWPNKPAAAEGLTLIDPQCNFAHISLMPSYYGKLALTDYQVAYMLDYLENENWPTISIWHTKMNLQLKILFGQLIFEHC